MIVVEIGTTSVATPICIMAISYGFDMPYWQIKEEPLQYCAFFAIMRPLSKSF